MKATINRKLFIKNISPIPATGGVSILIADQWLVLVKAVHPPFSLTAQSNIRTNHAHF